LISDLMPGTLAYLSTSGMASASLLVVLIALLAWLGIRRWMRRRVSADELERRRRALLNEKGKMGDATLVEVRGDLLFYAYDVRGVEYTASQDVSALRAQLPTDPSAVNGVVFVKYDPRNPANSIVLAEEWNGLRSLTARAVKAE
jgi:hypothetical protein